MHAAVGVGVVFLSVAAAVWAVGRYLSVRPSGQQRRVARRLRELHDPTAAGADERIGWLLAVALRVGRWGSRGHERRQADLRTQLATAGYRQPSAPVYFNAARVAASVAAAAVAGGVSASQQGWAFAVLWATAGGAVGFLLPRFVLSRLVAKRQRLIRHALPDAIDIMVLSTEGGVTLQAALDIVAEEIPAVHPVLGAELRTAQREVQFGLSPGEAVRALAERCGIAEARDLAVAIQQGERYGASVAKTLRTYSDTARQERQVWAEEMAQKAAVKILFPMLLCIFPAMFIVLLGPAAFQLSRLFAR